MAARYVRIGQYPDYRDEIRGTLLEILASTANPGTYAAPEDVAGCTLEMGADGLWTGASVGTLTQVQADALVAAGAMGQVKAGTPGNVAGTLVRWGGGGVGWTSIGIETRMVGNECHMGTISTMPSPAYDGRSYQLVQTLEGHVIGVRVVIRNNEPTSYTLDAFAVAPSATAVAGTVAPTGAWVAVTFGGVSNPTIPARLGVNRPSITVSDVIYFSTVTRTDGYDQPYIFLRGYNATGPKSGFVGTTAELGSRANWGSPTALNRGRIKWSASSVGNFVSSNQAGMSDDAGAFGSFCFEVQPIYSVPVLSIMGIGDSIISGDGASITGSGYGFRACADISTIARPVSWTNYGFSSMATANFVSRLTDAIAAGFRPSVLVVPSFSPNDGAPTQAVIDACKANLIQMLELCRANNITPIIVTPAPRSYAAPEEAFRQSLCAWVRGLHGRIILDADKILAATPGGNAQAAALSNDQLHPNDAGNDALSLGLNGVPGLKTILENLAALYFD